MYFNEDLLRLHSLGVSGARAGADVAGELGGGAKLSGLMVAMGRTRLSVLLAFGESVGLGGVTGEGRTGEGDWVTVRVEVLVEVLVVVVVEYDGAGFDVGLGSGLGSGEGSGLGSGVGSGLGSE